MKKITAIIKPYKLEEIENALQPVGEFEEVIFSHPTGNACPEDIKRMYGWRGDHTIHFLPRIKIEAYVEDGRAQHVEGAIRQAAHTGKSGDGLIWVEPVEAASDRRSGNWSAGISGQSAQKVPRLG
jgi:nitrogen regulatory protein P-II 1